MDCLESIQCQQLQILSVEILISRKSYQSQVFLKPNVRQLDNFIPEHTNKILLYWTRTGLRYVEYMKQDSKSCLDTKELQERKLNDTESAEILPEPSSEVTVCVYFELLNQFNIMMTGNLLNRMNLFRNEPPNSFLYFQRVAFRSIRKFLKLRI